MNIKAVIVDEVPDVCAYCQLENNTICGVIRADVEVFMYAERCPDCPLMTATQYEENNDLRDVKAVT